MKGAVAVVCLGLVCAFAAQAQALPERGGYVNDLAHVLSEPTVTQLETAIRQYHEQQGRGIYVLLVPTLEGMAVNAYDDAVTQAWGLEEQDVLMVISLQESAVHLSAGDKVKTLYTDEFLDSVMKSMIPALAQRDFDGGVKQGVTRLIGVGTGVRIAQPAAWNGTWRMLLLGGALALSLLLYLMLLA